MEFILLSQDLVIEFPKPSLLISKGEKIQIFDHLNIDDEKYVVLGHNGFKFVCKEEDINGKSI